jgi:hypothetical protein
MAAIPEHLLKAIDAFSEVVARESARIERKYGNRKPENFLGLPDAAVDVLDALTDLAPDYHSRVMSALTTAYSDLEDEG